MTRAYVVRFAEHTSVARMMACMEGCGFEHVHTGKSDGVPTAWGDITSDITTEYAENALEMSVLTTSFRAIHRNPSRSIREIIRDFRAKYSTSEKIDVDDAQETLGTIEDILKNMYL
jgi:hypothetical protein